MFYLNLVAKTAGYAEVAEACFQENFNTHLMWTRHRVLEEMLGGRLVVGGHHIRSVSDWDANLPHFARGTGAISFGASDLMDTAKVHVLKEKMMWVVENQQWFQVIEGLKVAGELLGIHFDNDFIVDGEGGSWDMLANDFNTLPYRSKDLICQMANGYNTPKLWSAICLYRDRMDLFAWFLLKDQTLPWSGMTVEGALNTIREPFKAAGNPIEGLPNRFELEKALRFGV